LLITGRIIVLADRRPTTGRAYGTSSISRLWRMYCD